MPRGGARPGSGPKKNPGRPIGSGTKVLKAAKRREELKLKLKDHFDPDILAEDDLDTVSYAKFVYRQLSKDAAEAGDVELSLQYLKEAVACARELLPYHHPRQSSVTSTVSVNNKLEQLSDDQIEALGALASVEEPDERPDGPTH